VRKLSGLRLDLDVEGVTERARGRVGRGGGRGGGREGGRDAKPDSGAQIAELTFVVTACADVAINCL
jgi:hypothetical protein